MELLTPRVNSNDNHAVLVGWHVQPWDEVVAGQTVCTIETTKAAVEVEVEAAGYFFPAAEKGQTVLVGQVLAWILPERSEALLNTLRMTSGASASVDVVISARARALMAAEGLSERDFPGQSSISESDVQKYRDKRDGLSAADLIAKLKFDDSSLLIWGGGYQGSVVIDLLSEGSRFTPSVVIDQKISKPEIFGLPVLRPENLAALRAKGLRRAHICIGDANEKVKVANILKAEAFSLEAIAHSSSVISATALLGEGVFIGPQVIIGPSVQLGDLCQINNAASIAHHSTIGRAVQISDGARIGGIVKIGDGSLVGIGTVVNSRISIGAGCTLVSGACIVSDVEGGTIVRLDGSRVKAV